MSTPALESDLARIARAYGRWIGVGQLATEEGVSLDTARRHLLAGSYGLPVDRQPGGAHRLLTSIYIEARRARLITRPHHAR